MSDRPVMSVERQCFSNLADVMEAIKQSGFWPTTCPSSYKLEQLSVLINRGSGSFFD